MKYWIAKLRKLRHNMKMGKFNRDEYMNIYPTDISGDRE